MREAYKVAPEKEGRCDTEQEEDRIFPQRSTNTNCYVCILFSCVNDPTPSLVKPSNRKDEVEEVRLGGTGVRGKNKQAGIVN